MIKCACFILLSFFFACRSHNYPATREGSTAICFATVNYILIGADTKTVLFDPITQKPIYGGRFTKVHQKDNIIYGIVGLLKNPVLNIYPVRTIDQLRLSGADLKSKIKQIELALYDTLKYVAEIIKVQQPTIFKSKYLNSNLSTFAFGTFENGKPVAGYLNFQCKVNAKGNIYLQDSISVNYSMPTELPIGHTEAIDSINKHNPNFYLGYKSPLDLLDDLIRFQSQRTPIDVNDTVDIIGMNSRGIFMFQKENVKLIVE